VPERTPSGAFQRPLLASLGLPPSGLCGPLDERETHSVADLRYVFGIGGVLLVQVAISYATILAGTGNGSFVGLGAMLLALYGIPATAILNFLLLRKPRRNPERSYVGWVIVISSVLPVLQVGLLIAQKTLDL
jgi:hypothetical protein